MATRARPVHAWAPLRDRRFRIGSAAFIGAQVVVWAQTVGAVEVITAQSGSAAAVAAIQTAITLPGMLLALVAGAIADAFDRRVLLVVSGIGMTAAMALLAALTAAGLAGTAIVLALTAALGTGLAILIPAFMTAVPGVVGRELLTAANTFVSAGTNVARAVGPALAGLALLVLGSGGLFWVLAAALALVAFGLAAAGLSSERPAEPERIGEAMRAGLRYVRHSTPLRGVIARSLLFLLFGSALWAILPLIAVRRLDLGASGFGVLLACVGTGAVLSALALGWIRERVSLEATVAGACVLLGVVLALLTVVRAPVITGALLLVAGAAWIAVVPTLNTVVALVSPAWVRGRALSVWFLGYNGGLALGSLAWGLLAEASLNAALLVPAAGLVMSVLARRLWPLHADHPVELLPADRLVLPATTFEPAGRDGPVLVTVAYDVIAGEDVAFAQAARALETLRRRDGARQWRLYRDVGRESVYVEVFTLATWAEHRRRHDRRTLQDVPIEQGVLALTRGYEVHYLVGAL